MRSTVQSELTGYRREVKAFTRVTSRIEYFIPSLSSAPSLTQCGIHPGLEFDASLTFLLRFCRSQAIDRVLALIREATAIAESEFSPPNAADQSIGLRATEQEKQPEQAGLSERGISAHTIRAKLAAAHVTLSVLSSTSLLLC